MNTRDKDEWDIVLNLKIFSVNEKNIKTHSNSKHVHVQLFQFSQNLRAHVEHLEHSDLGRTVG